MGATDGAGITGDAIGTTITRSTTTTDITRKAGRFITATDSIEENGRGVTTIALKELRSLLAGTANAHRVITAVPKEPHSLPAGKVRARAGLTTAPERLHSLSVATTVPLAATPSLAARVVFAPAPSAGTVMVERNAVFRRAEAPASVAEAAFTAAGATESTQL